MSSYTSPNASAFWTRIVRLRMSSSVDTPPLANTGSVFDGQAAVPAPGAPASGAPATGDTTSVRAGYAQSIAYTLDALTSWVQRSADPDLVVVVVGDHQPAPLVTGPGAGRDVPISILTRDPAVLARTAGWGWTDGLRPDPGAPTWPMEAFRDRFLGAFSPR